MVATSRTAANSVSIRSAAVASWSDVRSARVGQCRQATLGTTANRGDDALLCGGRNAMSGIDTDPEYTDVKSLVEMNQSEQAAWPGCRWKPGTGISGAIRQYLTEKTDSRGVTRRKTHLALVRLDPETRFGISMTSSGLQIAATFGWARISHVRTPVVNDWIDGVAARYAYLEEAQLEEHHYAEIRPGQARGDG